MILRGEVCQFIFGALDDSKVLNNTIGAGNGEDGEGNGDNK